MIMSKQMAVQDDVVEIVAKYAKQAGIEPSESLDRFLRMGISRHNALARYAQGGETKAPAKKAKAAPAKAPAKKAAKK
jgi:hypothetical protein